MKVAAVLTLCLCSVLMSLTEARPEPPSSQYGAPSGGYGRGPAGGSFNDPLSENANYNFMYAVKDAAAALDFGHMEEGQGDVARGSYYVLLPDGRMQQVVYVADQDGYKPTVTYTGEAKYGPPSVSGGKPGGYFYRR